ncbi:hypothetical protein DAEQUDRAFT_763369 [Daedalea quercina L-15889]|uniref:GDP/GTP exchange factor Sec2 N-terminal domain-containing protein n=1 Tax=Daedalea quercina L-15889 TaxID=1314783 RepID=A0A165SEK4_9APHY|nr:hypothetical protein DAEQUDRAFT_763369 [Daedalea quercina L-15889]
MSQPSHSRALSPVRSIDSEMHALNHEADYLDEKTHIVPHGPNGADVKLQRHNSDPDAQAMVIGSLRSQIQDLFSQVSQLNGKLVKSYDRMSDLEDELHVTSSNLRGATLKIGELELERAQHLSALSSGLLVEKDNVTAELNRLMERATEEAAQRGQAESARAEIEKELDDLSAGLFNQANSMVAEARIAQAKSERKVEETERALREAEEVVGLLQTQMQALQSEKERADRRVEDMRVTVGKGKWVERVQERIPAIPRLLSSHAPYQEYLSLIAHLRSIRPASQHPPAMSTLLPLPFLARLVTEDSDPTVRLDLAPSLNWLSRRSVISAIHSGELSIEPMPTIALLQELSPSTIPGQAHNVHISCALCGTAIISPSNSASGSPTTANFPSLTPRPSINNTWSSSRLFKNSLVHTLSAAPGSLVHSRSQSPAPLASGADASEPPAQVYIFRIAATSSGLPVSLPLSPQNNTQARPTIYPLCTAQWCLARLRTTCSMWAFVRTGIVEKIWDDGVYVPPASVRSTHSPAATVNGTKHDGSNGVTDADRKPPIPPRRSRMGIGALWGSMQRSLSGREVEAEKSQEGQETEKPLPKSPKKLPIPPPVHPSISTLPPSHPPTLPPPLPKRNRGREVATKEIAAPEPARATEGQTPTAPLLDRLVSADHFTTPDEEPAAFIHTDPVTVPLPPTAPATPEPQQASLGPAESGESASAETEQTTTRPSIEEPTADATPAAPLSAAVAANIQEHPSSRSGSPAPPPLPRRAAARPRPVSVVASTLEPTPTDNAGAASTEPIAPAPSEATESKDEGDAALPAETTTTSDATKPSETEVVDTSGATSTEQDEADKTEPPTDLPVAVDGVAPSEELPAHNGAEANPTQPNGVDHADLPPASGSDSGASQLDVDKPGDSDDVPHSPLAPSTNGVVDGVEGQSLKDREFADLRTSPEPEADGDTEDSTLYVGDATWEERTWKELTRLREDMFWARIGGVR